MIFFFCISNSVKVSVVQVSLLNDLCFHMDLKQNIPLVLVLYKLLQKYDFQAKYIVVVMMIC